MLKNSSHLLTDEHQAKWVDMHLFAPPILENIDIRVKLPVYLDHVRGSAASCIDVLGILGKSRNEDGLISFLNYFGLEIEEIIPFPSGLDIGGEVHNDKGNVLCEWIGPRRALLNEVGETNTILPSKI